MGLKRSLAKRLRSAVQAVRIGYYRAISDNAPRRQGITVNQPLFCTGRGQVQLTDCTIGVQPSPRLWDSYCHIEAREASATVTVAEGVWLNNAVTLIAERTSIRIDARCLLGHGVQIFDSDFHALDPALRTSGRHTSAPVHLEENVFIGAGSTILKGVTVGRNSVVAAGSVVTSDVPLNSVVAGSPARLVRRLETATG